MVVKSKGRKMKNNNSVTSFEQHLDKRYGKAGKNKRMAFEAKAKAFAIGELIKDERKKNRWSC